MGTGRVGRRETVFVLMAVSVYPRYTPPQDFFCRGVNSGIQFRVRTKPIPVRLGDDMIVRLDRAAARIGTTRAAVMRLLLTQWLESFEQKGDAALPVNWNRLLNEMDHRSESQKSELPPCECAGLGMAAETPDKPASTPAPKKKRATYREAERKVKTPKKKRKP